MAGNTISLTQTLDDRQYIEALNRQFQLMEKLEKKIQGVANQSKKAGDEQSKQASGISGYLSSQIKQYTQLDTVIGTVIGSIKQLIAAEEEGRRKSSQAALTEDDLRRRFRIQSGLRGDQATAAENAVIGTSLNAGMMPKMGLLAATQMVSSGFAPEAAVAATKPLLEGMAAMNQMEGDPVAIAQAVNSYMASQGIEKSAANVEDLMKRSFALFQGTNFQLPDLEEFATQADIFRGKMSSEEQFAMLATARESMGAAQATTAMRNFVSKLTSTKEKKPAQEALRAMGIKPEEIDLVGENISQANAILSAGIEKVPEADRATVLTKLFEEANVPFAQAMFGRQSLFKKNLAIQKNTEGYASAVALGTSGNRAELNRAQAAVDAARSAQYTGADVEALQLEAESTRRGLPELVTQGLQYGLSFGQSISGLRRIAGPQEGSGVVPNIEAALQENTAVMKENNNLMRQQNNGGKAPASPVMQQQRAN